MSTTPDCYLKDPKTLYHQTITENTPGSEKPSPCNYVGKTTSRSNLVLSPNRKVASITPRLEGLLAFWFPHKHEATTRIIDVQGSEQKGGREQKKGTNPLLPLFLLGSFSTKEPPFRSRFTFRSPRRHRGCPLSGNSAGKFSSASGRTSASPSPPPSDARGDQSEGRGCGEQERPSVETQTVANSPWFFDSPGWAEQGGVDKWTNCLNIQSSRNLEQLCGSIALNKTNI